MLINDFTLLRRQIPFYSFKSAEKSIYWLNFSVFYTPFEAAYFFCENLDIYRRRLKKEFLIRGKNQEKSGKSAFHNSFNFICLFHRKPLKKSKKREN